MKSYKKLIGNSFIFAVGTLGSKLISFLLVPLYTYYLSASQYGTVDLTVTTVNMLLPLVSASVFEAVLRFVMDRDRTQDQSVILSNSLLIAVMGFLVSFSFYPLLDYWRILNGNLIYLYLILLVQIFEKVFAQYARAIGKVKIFAINGILLTFTTGILNILFLVYFGMGVLGYFLALTFAYFISMVYLIIATKAYKNIGYSHLEKNTIKELLGYSIPLIPNSLMWWLINASSRYFIRIFVGIAANGLYAVASRIPSLINIVNQVFTQAWQLSAIEEYDSENKSEFYSDVFKHLSSIMFLASSAIIVVLKFIFGNFFAAEYFSSWKVVPFLLLGSVFSSYSSFLGTNYIAAKETKGVFRTSVYGGIISLVLNAIFIPTMGIVGAGISSTVSFFIMFLIRLYDTRQFVDIKISWKLFNSSLAILLLQTFILFVGLPMNIEIAVEGILFLLLMVLNRNLFISVLKMIQSLFNKKKSYDKS